LTDNPARPRAGAHLCALEDLPDPGSRGFLYRTGEALFLGFVVRRDDAVLGYIDRCPHAGMPLALMPNRYLTREGDLIVCSAHGALFRVADGLCVGGPCAGRSLTPWPVIVEDGAVLTG
jgi:nitrite reductase/ring-hydroxylating ferredoxin subunit